jgi:putative DNA primase/helicase
MMKEEVAARFEEAGLEESRFINVNEGEKGTYDHDTRYDDPRDVPGQNYGIYCAEDDPLVVLDVDVHRGGETEHDEQALVSLADLGFTLRVRSPHADARVGGHRIYKLDGDETPAELFDRVFGRKNPVPSWGEVVSKNKYVVGPGSQLDGCDKDWCDTCSAADGGHYEIDDDREIATVTPDELVEALNADSDLDRVDVSDDETQLEEYQSSQSSTKEEYDGEELTREQVEELLEALPDDIGFDEWITVGYAVLDWDDGQRGRDVYREWSESNDKWDPSEDPKQIDYIWRNGEPGDKDGNVPVDALIHKAREEGYDGSLTARKKQPKQEDAADWDDVRAVYAFAESDPDYPKGNGRMAAANVLERETTYMYVVESEILWVYNADSGTYQRYGRKHVANRLEQNLEEHYSSAEVREVISRLEARNQVHRAELNARTHDDPLLCVGNGVVNLRSGELLEHNASYRFVRGLDVEHDPDAADQEKIVEFLDEITEREADRDTLLDHLAHGLMPGHPYRAFVVCYGPGGNGKTQAAELFRGFVGRENAAAVEIDELANGDFATGDLPGTFLNWGDDMAGDGGGQLSDLSLLKKATGGSEIRANEKYEKTFNFKNEAAMFFSANEPPRIGEQKNSIADRIYPVEMPYKFKTNPDPANPMEKEKTPNVSKQLLDDEAAMEGLLLLAVKHASRLIDNRGRYSQPESPEERLEKYNQSADPIVNFATRVLEQADANTLIRKDDAYRVYQSFTDARDERAASERGFKRQLPGALSTDVEDARSRKLATADDEGDRVRCWKRVKLTETAKAHMPDWMVDRYRDHFESDETATEAVNDTGTDSSNPGLNALEPGRHTVEVTLAEQLDPKPWQQGRGHVTDDGEIMSYVAEGSSNPLADVDEGDRVRIRDAKVATDRDGVKQLEVSSVCDVEVVQTAASEQATVEDTASGEAATDGSGIAQLSKRVLDAVSDGYGSGAEVTVAAVAGELAASPDSVHDALERIVEEKHVLERTDDAYRRL